MAAPTPTDVASYFSLEMSNVALVLRENTSLEVPGVLRLTVRATSWGLRLAGSHFDLSAEEVRQLDSFLERLLDREFPCNLTLRRTPWKHLAWKVTKPARNAEFTKEYKGSVLFWSFPSAVWTTNTVSLRDVRDFRRKLGAVYDGAA